MSSASETGSRLPRRASAWPPIARRLILLAPLVLAACQTLDPTHESGLLGLEGRDRETLDLTYPPGTPRDVVRARETELLVFSIHPCDFSLAHTDRGLGPSLDAFRAAYPAVDPDCDIVRVGKTGPTTIVGGIALYHDYVYYDGRDQVLTSFRSFLSRSGR